MATAQVVSQRETEAERVLSWRLEELERALSGLLDVDLVSKGIARDGGTQQISDERAALAVHAWIATAVAANATSEMR